MCAILMLIQKKPNEWQCLPCAFAMCMNVTTDRLMRMIGHNGGEVTGKDKTKPSMYRGFHIQEIVDAALSLKFAITEIQRYPQLVINNRDTPTGSQAELDQRFGAYLQNSTGVLYGLMYGKGWKHAYAVDKGQVYDPDTGEPGELASNFCSEIFFKVDKLCD